jgi:hypothetical protein
LCCYARLARIPLQFCFRNPEKNGDRYCEAGESCR